MIQLVLVIGALVMLAFLLSRREIFTAVTSQLGEGDFCADGYLPPTLGIAPEWKNADVSQVRFFIDPTTGCVYISQSSRPQATIVVLSDRSQIARFISLNGPPRMGKNTGGVFAEPTTPLEVCVPVQNTILGKTPFGTPCNTGQQHCHKSTGEIVCR